MLCILELKEGIENRTITENNKDRVANTKQKYHNRKTFKTT
jgi:hypothetical protein